MLLQVPNSGLIVFQEEIKTVRLQGPGLPVLIELPDELLRPVLLPPQPGRILLSGSGLTVPPLSQKLYQLHPLSFCQGQCLPYCRHHQAGEYLIANKVVGASAASMKLVSSTGQVCEGALPAGPHTGHSVAAGSTPGQTRKPVLKASFPPADPAGQPAVSLIKTCLCHQRGVSVLHHHPVLHWIW